MNQKQQIIKPTHFRWIVVVLLFSITIINYIDRASISYAIDNIANSFHLDADAMGFLLGAFSVGYIMTTFLGGIAVDRFGARRILTITVLLWSLAMILIGSAGGFILIITARILLGMAEGPNFPSLTRGIGDWLPTKERAAALSYTLIAVPIALMLSGPFISQLIVHLTWRGTFFILAAIVLIWLPLWWWFFRDSPQKSKFVNQQELALIQAQDNLSSEPQHKTTERAKFDKATWSFLITNPTLLTNYWAFFVFGYYLFFFMNWLPSFLEMQFHVKMAKIGMLTIFPWALSAIFMWIAGRLSDYLLQKTKSYRYSRSYIILISQLLAALCIIPIILTNNLTIAIIFISFATAFSMSANPVFYAINIDIIKEHAATALGLMVAFSSIAGFLAPFATGWIVKITGHFVAAFLMLTILALSSVILVFLFHKPDTKYNKPIM